MNEQFTTTVDFLKSIGIEVDFRNIDYKTFLPGISIESGGIIVDLEKLAYPGDILHEAGHIAVVPTAERKQLSEAAIASREMREAEEMMAIAWSYAACIHLGFNANFVFHDHGYQGGGNNLAENFSEGRYFGVPMLQWTGMAIEKRTAENEGLPIYPKLLKWLRD